MSPRVGVAECQLAQHLSRNQMCCLQLKHHICCQEYSWRYRIRGCRGRNKATCFIEICESELSPVLTRLSTHYDRFPQDWCTACIALDLILAYKRALLET